MGVRLWFSILPPWCNNSHANIFKKSFLFFLNSNVEQPCTWCRHLKTSSTDHSKRYTGRTPKCTCQHRFKYLNGLKHKSQQKIYCKNSKIPMWSCQHWNTWSADHSKRSIARTPKYPFGHVNTEIPQVQITAKDLLQELQNTHVVMSTLKYLKCRSQQKVYWGNSK